LPLLSAAALADEADLFEGKWPNFVPTEETCPVPNMYNDVSADYWAKEPIENLGKLRIMEGFRDFSFRPERIVTRAELAVLIVRAKKLELKPTTDEMFKDVRWTAWVAPYIAAVVSREYMIGYPDGTFRPRQYVSRAEAAVTLSRAFHLFQEKCDGSVFPDIPRQHWACEAIDGADKAGLLKYLEGRDFEPAVGLTRAEAAEIISNIPEVKKRIAEELCEQ
jgi:hypothetical protein